MGWVLDDGDFHDILSGKRDDRPGYQAALARVRQLRTEGKRVVLVVAALDRLGRRLIERLRARDEFKRWTWRPTASVKVAKCLICSRRSWAL